MNKINLNFTCLPPYAKFLLDHKLENLATEQIRLTRELEIPLLKFFNSLNEGELLQLVKNSVTDFLTCLIENNAPAFIAKSLKQWKSDELPSIEKNQIITEDITLVSYVRKKALLHFIGDYTSDISLILRIVDEIDQFLVASETGSFKMHVDLLTEKVNEHLYIIEKITNTSPGIIYVFDLIEKKEIYSNDKVSSILGYTPNDLYNLGANFMKELQHPDDMDQVNAHFSYFNTAKDGELISFEHRLKAKDGNYKWLRNYESIFKRNEKGEPSQIIGISLEIDQEKKMAEELKYREDQLLEAQELAELGSFEWNLVTRKGIVTPQVLKILNLEPGAGFAKFLEGVHHSDREKVQQAIEKAAQQHSLYNYECRYKNSDQQKVIWSRGAVSLKDGEPVIKGTLMDITARHELITKLKSSEELYKEAQSLTNIGNWIWERDVDTIIWSDEVYRIFGLEPQCEAINYRRFVSFIHPDDRVKTIELLQKSLLLKHEQEYLVRVVSNDSRVKILQIKSETKFDEHGVACKLVGTCQDQTEKQLLIKRLEFSEQLYKQAQALSHIGNWSWNLESNELTWSDEIYRIYELEPSNTPLTIADINKYLDPVDIKNNFNLNELNYGIAKAHNIYYRINLPSGTTKTIHSIGEVKANATGEPYLLMGTLQDVTQQKETEKQLLANQNFIRKIADATPSIIASYNINTGVYSYISEGLKKLLGYETEQAIKEGAGFVMPLIHPDDVAELMIKNAEAIERANTTTGFNDNNFVVEFRYRMKHKNGEYRWFRTYGTIFSRDSDGKVEHILNISLDVTEKVEAEKQLAEQQSFTKHIAEASPTILYLFDLEQRRFLYINKEVTEVLGYLPEEIIELGDKAGPLFLHPEDEIKSGENHTKYKHSAGSSSMHQFEGRVLDKHGNWKWILTREIVFKRDEEGKAIQIVGSALDITDRKEMEQALINKTFELQQSNARLEEFAHIASHDLQEPLRKISTFGDRLRVSFYHHLSEDGKSYLDKIISSSKRMQQLINDILSISTISGDRSFYTENLQSILDEVVQTLEFKIEKNKALILSDYLPEAQVVPSQFRQLFQNLLSNSIKFVSADAKPIIKIRHQYLSAAQVAKFNLKNASRYLKIEFEDNGIGFENVFAEKVFSIFQRLHSTKEYEGTGIGLAICKKIVENHGGVIFATSARGEGAIFTIIIPA